MDNLLRIAPGDDVAVALKDLSPGEEAAGMRLREVIPAGHKAALRDIARGEKIVKYGFPIGEATRSIPAGSHVHTQNLRTLLSADETYVYHKQDCALPPASPSFFEGYPRADGRVGIRNELWILPTVGCVSDVARALEREGQALTGGGVEGIFAFSHPYGCSQLGEDQENTRRILADLAAHPNAGGVLVLGLGCENSGVEEIKARLGAFDASRIRFLVCQQHEDEIAAGLALLEELADRMRPEKRVPCPASKLVVGLKCGGSDGFSGITANPVIGGFSDRLIAQGGSAILTEVPEMFGAERILMDRCENETLFRQTVDMIRRFKMYYADNGQPVYENPSPGNKEGGITTLEEKSLGCVQKSGIAPVEDVLLYGEKVRKQGLSLLSSPSNDLVAATAQAAAGAQMVLFSTGRGTPFACPVPTVKIASNSALARKKARWIDFNAGELLEGASLAALSQALFDEALLIASGKKVVSETSGYRDMAIFKSGVTL